MCVCARVCVCVRVCACKRYVCGRVCVSNPFRYHAGKNYFVKIRKGAMAPFISPWPTKLLMLGEDMQSDQLHVTAIGTVDFCFSMKLFALKV